MKRVGIALVTILILFIGVYFFWVSSPAITNSAPVDEAIKATKTRLDELQSHANNPDENGFLNKTFVVYWGVTGQQYTKDSEIEKTVEAWSQNYSSQGTGEVVNHADLAAKKDAEYLAKREAFAAEVPGLVESLNKPYFVAPEKGRRSITTLYPNLVAMRAVAQGLSGYGEALASEKKYDEAINVYIANWNLGKNLYSQGSLLYDAIGNAIQSLTSASFETYIRPELNVSAADWKRVADALADRFADKDAVFGSVQGEVTIGVWYLEDSLSGKTNTDAGDISQELSSLSMAPGILDRERRMYWNTCGEFLEAVKNDKEDEFFKRVEKFDLGTWFSGDMSVLAAVALPNVSRSEANMSIGRKHLQALAVACALISQNKATGSFPNAIQDLAATYPKLKEAGALDLEFQYQAESGSLLLPLAEAELEKVSTGEASWVSKEKDGIKFSLKGKG